MSKGIIHIKSINVRFIDLQTAFTTTIEPHISDDVYKYNLRTNTKLLRQFTVYRLTTFILSVLETNFIKTVFVLPENIKSSLYKDNEIFIKNTFRAVISMLSLNLMKGYSLDSVLKYIESNTGEGKELRSLVHGIISSNNKNVNLQKFNKFLEKYHIHKVQGEISQNFNVKLGLFVT